MTATVETHEFQTEARQLLDLMVHSIYSNKDIFLRELISNSSDASDRRKFEGVQQPELLEGNPEMEIWLEPDSDARTLTISDRGIGMTRDEVMKLIGTIAKSGTKEFVEKLKESKEKAVSSDMIGQFGVGFYSGFMVADKVTLETRHAGEATATRWEWNGEGTYTLEEVERDQPGTSVTLHLKETDDEDGLSDYTQEWKLRSIVKKYSDFVAYPIKMNIERTEVERDEEGKPKEGAEEKTIIEAQTLNSMKAIWLKEKSDVSDEELTEFYKHISHDWNKPFETISAKIEGTLEYRLLLFIPEKLPMDQLYRDAKFGLQLYVKRVFIMDDCKELVPEYLRFIRGVVDSEDLSLNISREILQQDRQIQRMQKGIVGKVLDSLKSLFEKDRDRYLQFWKEFGRILKEGIYLGGESKDQLLGMALFESTEDDSKLTSLAEYVLRMKPDQDAIYYMTGESRTVVENSPHLEAFKKKDYEVLILTDPVDEVWAQSTPEFDGKTLQSIGKGDVELGSEEEKKKDDEERKTQEKKFETLLECLQKNLDEVVKEVRISNRLETSAACLVGDEGDLSPQLEEMMKSMGQDMPKTKRILEVNPGHPIVEKLQGMFEADPDAAELADYADLLYGQALLAEGGQLKDPGKFAKLVADVMVKAL
jgi:molecular chaperone HtpG